MDVAKTPSINAWPFSHPSNSTDVWIALGKHFSPIHLYAICCTSKHFYNFVWSVLLPVSPVGMVFSPDPSRSGNLAQSKQIVAKFLSRVPNLATLSLPGTKRQGLSPFLVNLPKLKSLTLPGGCQSPQFLSHLTDLTHLNIPSGWCSDLRLTNLKKLVAGDLQNHQLASINALPSLEYLAIMCSDSLLLNLGRLSSLTALTSLEYYQSHGWSSRPTNDKIVGTMPRLQRLVCDLVPVLQDYPFTNLTHLEFDSCDNPSFLKICNECTKLRHLVARNLLRPGMCPTQLTPDGTVEISRLTNLVTLTAYDISLAPETFHTLSNLINLTHLHIPRSTDDFTPQTEGTRLLTNLKYLEMSRIEPGRLDPIDLRSVRTLYLEKLRLKIFDQFRLYSDFKDLTHMTTLKILVLEAGILVGNDFQLVTREDCQHLRGLTNLENLSLINCKNVDGQLEDLNFMTQLTELNILNSGISVNGLQTIAEHFTGLKTLALCTKSVHNSSLECLNKLTSLRILDLRSSSCGERGTTIRSILPNLDLILVKEGR